MNRASEAQVQRELVQTLEARYLLRQRDSNWDHRLRGSHRAEFVFPVAAIVVAPVAHPPFGREPTANYVSASIWVDGDFAALVVVVPPTRRVVV